MVRVPPSPPYNPDNIDAGPKNPDCIRVFRRLWEEIPTYRSIDAFDPLSRTDRVRTLAFLQLSS